MELYHLKIYIDDLLHRAVGPVAPPEGPVGPVGPIIYLGQQQHLFFFIYNNAVFKILPS